MFARKQNSVIRILQSINSQNLKAKKNRVKSQIGGRRNRMVSKCKNRRKLRPADVRSRYLSVNKESEGTSEESKGAEVRTLEFRGQSEGRLEIESQDIMHFDPTQLPEVNQEINYAPAPSPMERVTIEMKVKAKSPEKPPPARKSTFDQESPQIQPQEVNKQVDCKSRETTPEPVVRFSVFEEDRRCTLNFRNDSSKGDSISKLKCKKRKKRSQGIRKTKVISFQLSDVGEQENKENECQEVPELVTSQEKSPFKKSPKIEKITPPVEKVDSEFDSIASEEEEVEIEVQSRNKLPMLRESKSIERLNTLISPRRSALPNQSFKLIGADLRESLKNKIDQGVLQHRNNFLESMKLSKNNGFSLKLNEFVQTERKSNLEKFRSRDKPINGLRRNFESFIVDTKTPKTKLTGTLKKILNNSIVDNGKRSCDNLHSFVGISDDVEIKNKIKKNQNALRLKRELRELYQTKKQLKEITMPEYPGYLGYFFRKCYYDHTSSSKPSLKTSSKSCLEDRSQGNLGICEILKSTSQPDLLSTSQDELSTACLPHLSSEWLKIHHDHLIESLQTYQYLNDLTTPTSPPIIPPCDPITPVPYKKLLIFDMDETLIHCVPNAVTGQESEVRIPVEGEKGVGYKYVNLRPYVRECLLELSEWYQIIVFTASTQEYADPILDYLDKDKLERGQGLIKKRYYRRHCYKTKDNCTMKDLRIFEEMGYDLKDVILVDNATHCFGFQVTNGIPMVPFYKNQDDKEMIHLLHFLKKIKDVPDVRPILSKTFMLPKLRKNRILESIEGVIEQRVEEVDDDFFLEDQLQFENTKSEEAKLEDAKFEDNKFEQLFESAPNPIKRETMSNCTLEEVCAEGVDEVKINTLMRAFPKTQPLNITLKNYNPKKTESSKAFSDPELEEFDIVETVVVEC